MVKHKLLSGMLALCLLLALVPTVPAQAGSVTPEAPTPATEGIARRVAEILAALPDQTAFTTDGLPCTLHASGSGLYPTPCAHCNLPQVLAARPEAAQFYTGTALSSVTCYAFGVFLANALYGKNNFDHSTDYTQTREPVIGDFVCDYIGGSFFHVGLFLGWVDRSKGTFLIYDSNGMNGHGYRDENHYGMMLSAAQATTEHIYGVSELRTGVYNHTAGAVRFFHANNYDERNTLFAPEPDCSEDAPAEETAFGTVIRLSIGSPDISVNGETFPIDEDGTVPVILNDRTMIPVRCVIEALGGEVGWDGALRRVTLKLAEKTLYLDIDSTVMRDGSGNIYSLDTPPTIIGGRTLLPIRYVAEYFGAEVDWEDATRTVIIRYAS